MKGLRSSNTSGGKTRDEDSTETGRQGMNGVRWQACRRDLEQTEGLRAKWAEPKDWDVIAGARNDQRKASSVGRGDSKEAIPVGALGRERRQFRSAERERSQ